MIEADREILEAIESLKKNKTMFDKYTSWLEKSVEAYSSAIIITESEFRIRQLQGAMGELNNILAIMRESHFLLEQRSSIENKEKMKVKGFS